MEDPADRRGLARKGQDPAEGPGALFEAIAGFYSDGKRLDGKKRDDLRRMVATVPALVSWGAAGLIHGLRAAITARERAFKRVSLGSNILGGEDSRRLRRPGWIAWPWGRRERRGDGWRPRRKPPTSPP